MKKLYALLVLTVSLALLAGCGAGGDAARLELVRVVSVEPAEGGVRVTAATAGSGGEGLYSVAARSASEAARQLRSAAEGTLFFGGARQLLISPDALTGPEALLELGEELGLRLDARLYMSDDCGPLMDFKGLYDFLRLRETEPEEYSAPEIMTLSDAARQMWEEGGAMVPVLKMENDRPRFSGVKWREAAQWTGA